MITDTPGGVIIDIKVIPRAGRTALAGTRDNALLIRLAAAPVEGAANAELIALLSRVLALPKHSLVIVSGERSRIKRVKVAGVDADTVRARLKAVEGQ